MHAHHMNPLKAQELLLAQSIIINNEKTTDYITMWFDGMLDKLCEMTGQRTYFASLGSMIYDISEKTKVKRGLFRYNYKKTVIRYDTDPLKHTIHVDLYLFDDVLKVSAGCYNSVISFTFNGNTSIRNIENGLTCNSYFMATTYIPNREAGMSRDRILTKVTGELMDFIAIMLFSVMRRKTIIQHPNHTVFPNAAKTNTTHSKRKVNDLSFENVTIDETKKTPVYKNINRSRGHIDHQYFVRGHYRHYKSGIVVYIQPQVRCKDKPPRVLAESEV